MTPLEMYAISLHELYMALLDAGFTEVQATYLTAQRMKIDA